MKSILTMILCVVFASNSLAQGELSRKQDMAKKKAACEKRAQDAQKAPVKHPAAVQPAGKVYTDCMKKRK